MYKRLKKTEDYQNLSLYTLLLRVCVGGGGPKLRVIVNICIYFYTLFIEIVCFFHRKGIR